MKKLQPFDSIYFRGKSHFEEEGTQNYLVFQLVYKCFNRVVNSDYILEWKYKGLSDESIKSLSSSNIFRNPELSYYGNKLRVIFSGSCLKQDKITYDNGKVVNINTVYKINKTLISKVIQH